MSEIGEVKARLTSCNARSTTVTSDIDGAGIQTKTSDTQTDSGEKLMLSDTLKLPGNRCCCFLLS